MSNTLNAWRIIAKKGTNNSAVNAFKALANEDFFMQIASVASNIQVTSSSSKKVDENTQTTTSSQNAFSEFTHTNDI